MPVEELKAAFGYLACAFGHLNPFGAGHCTKNWESVETKDRLGCRPHFAVDKVTAETDVAGTAGVLGPADMLLCALVGMVFVMSVLASHLKVQQHCLPYAVLSFLNFCAAFLDDGKTSDQYKGHR